MLCTKRKTGNPFQLKSFNLLIFNGLFGFSFNRIFKNQLLEAIEKNFSNQHQTKPERTKKINAKNV